MSDFAKSMEEIFDVTPKSESTVPAVIEKKETPVATVDKTQDLEDAYQQSRDNLQDLIDQGKEAMESMLEIAKASEHPRAFEVYGTLLKNVLDANKELLGIQKQIRDISSSGKKESTGTTIDKAIFVGSTAELNKLIKGKE